MAKKSFGSLTYCVEYTRQMVDFKICFTMSVSSYGFKDVTPSICRQKNFNVPYRVEWVSHITLHGVLLFSVLEPALLKEEENLVRLDSDQK